MIPWTPSKGRGIGAFEIEAGFEVGEGWTMWIMFERARSPDAAWWPGRRWLAAIDAISWPVAAGLLLVRVPERTGVFLPTAIAILALLGLLRLRKAVWINHRYRFTTSRVAVVLMVLMLIGIVLKVGVA